MDPHFVVAPVVYVQFWIYSKMQAFVMECYVEPENIPTEIVQDEDEDILDLHY
jgi:hypothetical protein